MSNGTVADVILVGGFHEIIELCETCGKNIVGIIDPQFTAEYRGCEVLGNDADARALSHTYRHVPLILVPDDPRVRRRLARLYGELGFTFSSLIHPQTTISQSAHLGRGTIIQAGANISSNVQIGDFVKINSGANVMHDAVVGSCSTIAPNAVLLGSVSVGEGCYVGANSTILPNACLGPEAVVGAGAVVTKDVAPGTTVVGNPARVLT